MQVIPVIVLQRYGEVDSSFRSLSRSVFNRSLVNNRCWPPVFDGIDGSTKFNVTRYGSRALTITMNGGRKRQPGQRHLLENRTTALLPQLLNAEIVLFTKITFVIRLGLHILYVYFFCQHLHFLMNLIRMLNISSAGAYLYL